MGLKEEEEKKKGLSYQFPTQPLFRYKLKLKQLLIKGSRSDLTDLPFQEFFFLFRFSGQENREKF